MTQQQVQTYLMRKLTNTFRIMGPRDLAATIAVLFVVAVALLWLVFVYPSDGDSATVVCEGDATSATCTRY
ncbi:hypothetical protein ACIRON_02620 [Nocardioides sp. NPDC101246]|uniref:hypothetical protein n=1 Tax=Nocardioides sp. NPDC101246 TaxID=3364336 RepID=UPI003816209E